MCFSSSCGEGKHYSNWGNNRKSIFWRLTRPYSSRCRVFVLKSLQKEDIVKLFNNVIKDERGYGNSIIDISGELIELIARYSNGDARTALNVLEMAVMSGEIKGRTTIISKEIVEGCIQKRHCYMIKMAKNIIILYQLCISLCVIVTRMPRFIGWLEC